MPTPRPVRSPRRPDLRPAALGLPAGIAAALLACALGANPVSGTVCAALAALAVGFAVPGSVEAAGAAVLCWAFADGFVLHHFGELHAGGADTLALGVVLAAGLTGGAVRTARARRRDYAAVRARPRSGTVAVTIGHRIVGSP